MAWPDWPHPVILRQIYATAISSMLWCCNYDSTAIRPPFDCHIKFDCARPYVTICVLLPCGLRAVRTDPLGTFSISQPLIIRFREIWHMDTNFYFEYGHITKNRDIWNPRWRTDAILKIVFRLISTILSNWREIWSKEAELHSETVTRPNWQILKIQDDGWPYNQPLWEWLHLYISPQIVRFR